MRKKVTMNGLPSYWMDHIERPSFFFHFLIFTGENGQSESARAEKSKSLWHLNKKATLVYFLCKKSSVRKPLLWNTCHTPFYWTLLRPQFLASRSFHYQFLHRLQYWKWAGGDGKENKHTNIQHIHQMDSSDNKCDFNPQQEEVLPVPASDVTSPSDTYWQIWKDSSLLKVSEARSSFQSDHQLTHKVTHTSFMRYFIF